MGDREPLRDPPEPRRRQEGDEKVVLRRREADWTGEERSSHQDMPFAVQRAAVRLATAALAAHDGLTAGHADDVVTLCGTLANPLGLSELQRVRLLAAARLHDLGKVAVPQGVLDKPGPLDSAEWTLIRDHTLCGERILQSVPELSEVGHIVRHSHERWDGAGYPDGLAGDEIPLESRIVFCADAFHAIRCDRPYRGGRSAALALEELRRHSGTQFDPTVIEALEQEAASLRDSASVRLAAMTSTVRSKRLVALLLSLVVSGSALAAPGSPLRGAGNESHAAASPPAACADPCVRGQVGGLAAPLATTAAGGEHRRATPGASAPGRPSPADRPSRPAPPASNDAERRSESRGRAAAPVSRTAAAAAPASTTTSRPAAPAKPQETAKAPPTGEGSPGAKPERPTPKSSLVHRGLEYADSKLPGGVPVRLPTD